MIKTALENRIWEEVYRALATPSQRAPSSLRNTPQSRLWLNYILPKAQGPTHGPHELSIRVYQIIASGRKWDAESIEI